MSQNIYMQTTLWQAAFSHQSDGLDQQRTMLSQAYESFRDRVSLLLAQIQRELPTLTLHDCRIPDDCIDPRRYPLLAAREAMRQLVDDLLGRSILAPGAFS